MSQRNDELEARLIAWAKEYGEGNGPGIGWSGQNLLLQGAGSRRRLQG